MTCVICWPQAGVQITTRQEQINNGLGMDMEYSDNSCNHYVCKNVSKHMLVRTELCWSIAPSCEMQSICKTGKDVDATKPETAWESSKENRNKRYNGLSHWDWTQPSQPTGNKIPHVACTSIIQGVFNIVTFASAMTTSNRSKQTLTTLGHSQTFWWLCSRQVDPPL